MDFKQVLIVLLVIGASNANPFQFIEKLFNGCGAGWTSAFQVVSITSNVWTCMSSLADFANLGYDLTGMVLHGPDIKVFEKYCAKSPQLRTCIRSLVTGFTPCVPSETRQYIPGINNSTDQLIDFVCYQDGDRIALFIAEKGPECFKEKSGDIRQCAENIKSSVDTVEKAMSLITLKEQCAKFDTLSACIVTALSNCETPTPGNMAESLLRSVKNGGPCKEK